MAYAATARDHMITSEEVITIGGRTIIVFERGAWLILEKLS